MNLNVIQFQKPNENEFQVPVWAHHNEAVLHTLFSSIFFFLFYFGWKIHKNKTNLIGYSTQSYREFLVDIPII